MRIRFTIFIFFFSYVCFSQDCELNTYKYKRVVKKAKKYIKKGRSDAKMLYKAYDLLNKERDIPYFSALKAELFWLRGEDFNAEEEGLFAIEFCADLFPEVYYLLGDIAFSRKDYVNAEKYLKKSIQLEIGDPYYSDAVMLFEKAKIIAGIINNPVPFSPNIVHGISTKNDEYLPLISPDQELVFFTRRSSRDSKQDIFSNTIEKFVKSQKTDGIYGVGDPLEYPFNLENNEGGASITIDNKVLYYTKCIRDKSGYNNCDIYYVYKKMKGWSEVQSFPKNICGVNTWESQPTISSDGKTLIFASDRSGGFGKTDLYEINFVDGKWSEPKNLGSNINSNEHEKSPYLHTDGVTLFFSSTNFPSIGGFDIFYSRKDSLGNWKEPINIGYPINTLLDEVSLVVSTDGDSAYFASNQLNGVGGMDIYSFPLHDNARPERVLFLKGSLLDSNGGILDDVEIEIKNINTSEITTVKVSSGEYCSSLTLADDDDVIFTVKKKGFAFNSTYISSDDINYRSPVDMNIKLEAIENGKSFRIENIYFPHNSFEINAISKEVLLLFSDYLKINNNIIIEINGFTDDVGDDSSNQVLSENRARSVYQNLIDNGISKDRISYNGYGEKNPISDNKLESGRAKNRRTEFKVLSQ